MRDLNDINRGVEPWNHGPPSATQRDRDALAPK